MGAARTIATLLAAAVLDGQAVLEALGWFAGVVVTTLVATVVATYVRRRWRAGDDPRAPSFTLEELRRLKERGDLTDAEYHALLQKVLVGEQALDRSTIAR